MPSVSCAIARSICLHNQIQREKIKYEKSKPPSVITKYIPKTKY